MAQNAKTTDGQTQKERVLRVLDDADGSLTSKEVYERLFDRADVKPADTLSGVRGTLSYLKTDGKVETTNDGDRLRYLRATDEEPADEDEPEDDDEDAQTRFKVDEENDGTGLAVLFDSVDEGESGTNGEPPGSSTGVSEEEVEALYARIDALEQAYQNSIGETVETVEDLSNRLTHVERRATKTGYGGEDAALCLPVADSDAPLDHATVIHELGSREQVRTYLRALLGLPEDTTASEQRAEEEAAFEVVEKDE